MHWIETVASYLPSLIVEDLISNRTRKEELPSRQPYDTVCLFADVSGFTALSEAMMLSSKGEGVEGLARHLNAYFGQMVRIIASEGGDVFKFAGDALIVLWPPAKRDSVEDAKNEAQHREPDMNEGSTPMQRRVRRAAQCAFAIQEALHNCELAQEVRLSVKIGIGMGKLSVLHLGGVYSRMEYIAVGEPLLEAFTAEHHASPGDVIISEQAYKLVKGQFTATEVFSDDYCKISKEHRHTPMRKQNKVNMLNQKFDDPLLEAKVKGYIPVAVIRNLRPDSPEDEHWSNEIRRVTVLFVSLGLNEQTLLAAAVYDEAMKEMHKALAANEAYGVGKMVLIQFYVVFDQQMEVMVAVQESVYEYEGSINKFLMDDKGSTLVAVYGLPPVGHANDPIRGVLAALRLCERLFDLVKTGSVGITTGQAFCGVVGSKTRKEYTVLGDSVNLAARLMQRATAEDGGVLCEFETKRACVGLLEFKSRGDFRIKGKTAAAKVFQPYPPGFPKPRPPQYLGANVYGMMHNQQRQNYVVHKLFNSVQAYIARPQNREKDPKDANNYSSQTSGMSTPVSDQRNGITRWPGSSRPSHTIPPPSTNNREDSEDEEIDGGDVQNTLLGKGEYSTEESEDEDGISEEGDAVHQHSELQEPIFPEDAMHRPFKTGPLPMDLLMDENNPIQVMHGGGEEPAALMQSASRDNPDLAENLEGVPGLPVWASEPVNGQGGNAKRNGSCDTLSPSSANPALPARSMGGKRQGDSIARKVFRSRLAESEGGTSPSQQSPSSRNGRDYSLAASRSGVNSAPLWSSGQQQEQDQDQEHVPANVEKVELGVPSTTHSGTGNATGAVHSSWNIRNVIGGAPVGSSARGGSSGLGGGGNMSRVSPFVGAATVMPRSKAASRLAGIAHGTGGGSGPVRSLKVGGVTGAGANGGVAVGNTSRGGSGPINGSWLQRRSSTAMGSLQSNPSRVRSGSPATVAPDAYTSEEEPPLADDSGRDPVEQETKGEGVVPILSKPKEGISPISTNGLDRSPQRMSTTAAVTTDVDVGISARATRPQRKSTRLSITQNGMVPLPPSPCPPVMEAGLSMSLSMSRNSLYSGYNMSTLGGTIPSCMAPISMHAHNDRASTTTNHSAISASHLLQPAASGPALGAQGFATSFTAAYVQNQHGVVSDEFFHDIIVQVIVPLNWEWKSMPDHVFRLRPIFSSEVTSFKMLVDRCWEYASADSEVMGPNPPSREDLVLNILGTRVMLPTEPDYNILWLDAFLKEACGARDSRGFMDRKRSPPLDFWPSGGSARSTVDLCLLPRREILNVQTRWLQSRISLLQHKIALISNHMGSVVILEGLPGAGKTEVLSIFAARTLPRTAAIHLAAASPFQANQSFGGWSMVLQQYLDTLDKQVQREESMNATNCSRASTTTVSDQGRLTNGAGILGQKPPTGRDRILLKELECFPEMQAHAFLVNEVLGTKIPVKSTVPPAWDARSSLSSNREDSDGSDSDGSDNEESSGRGFKHHERLRFRILLQLVKNMARHKPRLVIIDDAQFLDKDSWTLALAVATGDMGRPLPLMLVLSLRPLAHYRGLYASIPPDYQALIELEHVDFLKIEGAPPEEVEDLVSEKLGANVLAIGNNLFELLEDRCSGNPLMITELVSHLKMMEPQPLQYVEIRSEGGEQGERQNSNMDEVSLVEGFQLDYSLLPEKINAVLTSQTDRLNSCQLMALKVASLIGREFSTWFLYRVYPVNGHKDRLLKELVTLEEHGFLVEVQDAHSRAAKDEDGSTRMLSGTGRSSTMAIGGGRPGSGENDPNNLRYKFTHGFMMEMLQLKMLNSQKRNLKDRIQKLKDSIETQKRHEMYKNVTIDNSRRFKAGTLFVMKHKVVKSQAAMNARETTRRPRDTLTSRAMRRVKQPVQQKLSDAVHWKRRTCLLTSDSLSLFTDSKDAAPSQVVFLQGATAQLEVGEAFKNSAFRLETNRWKKGEEIVESDRRTFTFLADSKEIAEHWLYRIRYCIELMEVQARKSGTVNLDSDEGYNARAVLLKKRQAQLFKEKCLYYCSARHVREHPTRSFCHSGAKILFSQVNSTRFGFNENAQSESSDGEDSTLIVTVEEADDLILEEVYGTTYPYCFVDLDDQRRRTRSVQSASIKPAWRQEVQFPVSVQQWINSKIRIQVWNHDLFLADDFLGQLTIPLKDVPIQGFNRDSTCAVSEPKWYNLEPRHPSHRVSGRLLLGVRLKMTERTSAWASEVGFVENLKTISDHCKAVSSMAARVGQLQQRKNSAGGGHHHRMQPDGHHHHRSHHNQPAGIPPPVPSSFRARAISGNASIETSIRASIRSLEHEAAVSMHSTESGQRPPLVPGGSLNAGVDSSASTYRGESTYSIVSVDGGEDDSIEGGTGSTGRSRKRRSERARGRSRRQGAEGSSHGVSVVGMGTAMSSEVLHQDPLTRQLQLMLLAVETKANITTPEESGSGSVNREWIRTKLKELLTIVGRGDIDLDELETHTYYCKDRKENVYGPFPGKQLVEAHNAGYIHDRKVLVKEAKTRGEFRPIGELVPVTSHDEAFKSLTTWPQADAHHPLADKILGAEYERKDFRRWSFDIFLLENSELALLAATIFSHSGLPRVLGIKMKRFAHFMSAVASYMGRNTRVSYHNLYHAVDVLHATSVMLDGMGAWGLLNDVEQLALLLSALCHDLDHPGLTNSFQTATGSPLAALYNDQTPLEHHHLAVTLQILRREDCDILGHLDKTDRDRIREVMIQGILATEMSEHNNHLKKMNGLTGMFPKMSERVGKWAAGEIGPITHDRSVVPGPIACLSTHSPGENSVHCAGKISTTMGGDPVTRRSGRESLGAACAGIVKGESWALPARGAEGEALGLESKHRLMVASALLHGADVSSSGRPWKTCQVWVTRLLEEFKFQAEQERQRGLHVSVLEGPPAENQPRFIKYLMPFFTVMLPVAPGLEDEFMPHLHQNRDNWEDKQNFASDDSQHSDYDGQPSSNQQVQEYSQVPPGERHGEVGNSGSSGFGSGAGRLGGSNAFRSDSKSRRNSSGTIGLASLVNGLGTVTSALGADGVGGVSGGILGALDSPPSSLKSTAAGTHPRSGNHAAWNSGATGITHRRRSTATLVRTSPPRSTSDSPCSVESECADNDEGRPVDGGASGSHEASRGESKSVVASENEPASGSACEKAETTLGVSEVKSAPGFGGAVVPGGSGGDGRDGDKLEALSE